MYNYIGLGLNLKFGEMEFGEMKRNTSNWSNFCMRLRRAGLTASAGLSCLPNVHCYFRLITIKIKLTVNFVIIKD